LAGRSGSTHGVNTDAAGCGSTLGVEATGVEVTGASLCGGAELHATMANPIHNAARLTSKS